MAMCCCLEAGEVRDVLQRTKAQHHPDYDWAMWRWRLSKNPRWRTMAALFAVQEVARGIDGEPDEPYRLVYLNFSGLLRALGFSTGSVKYDMAVLGRSGLVQCRRRVHWGGKWAVNVTVEPHGAFRSLFVVTAANS